MPADQLIQVSADWRKSLRSNNRRTVIVIGLFFLIYLGLGLLVDLYIQAGHFPEIPLEEIFFNLVTFKLFPLASIVMLSIAAISLLVTFSMYDKLMLLGTEYREITATTAKTIKEKQLYNAVEEMKIAAGLHYMPKVFIIEADYMNAFASGYSERSAMVAITRGLMDKLTRDELQAVMAHELSHIRHMDIKLTLMASVLANLTLMVLDIFFYNAIFSNRQNSDSRRNGLGTIILILRYLLPLINMLLLLYLSRTREYMADAGCVELLRDNKPLATALIKIQNDHQENNEKYAQEYQQTPHENIRREAYIFDPVEVGIKPTNSIADLFSTHPTLQNRLAAIGFKYDKK